MFKTCSGKTCADTICEDCESLTPSMCGNGLIPTLEDICCNNIYFVGLDDITVPQFGEVDLVSGVHAYDGNGLEVPYTYTPTEVDTSVAGEYIVTYKASGIGEAIKPTVCGEDALHLMDCGYDTATAHRIITVVQTGAVVCEANVCGVYVIC